MYVLAIARPELAEKQVWGGATRDFTSISLEPLAPEAMGELLGGLVPGLPEELRDRIRDRAEGVPLYAVETVRMLLDRGLLRREGDQYVAADEVESLEVPETLHGLIAARLDGLEPRERAAVDDAAVLGKTFTKAALAALTGLGEDELVPILSSLVRKDLLTMQTDPRSPERGNYGFLQALVQRIAYETLARKERKARHLAAARHFEHGWGSEDSEIVEVIASHYLDAYRADPEAPDAAEIRVAAREALVRAGRRAASVAANEEAQRYFQQAADLAVEESRLRAELLEEAGSMAEADNRNFEAIDLFEEAIALCASEGLTHTGARVEAKLGFAMWNSGQIDKAAERMQRSFAILAGDEPDEDLAMLAAQLARFRVFMGDSEDADEPLEFALDAAEARRLPHVVSEALNTKSLILARRGRPEESLALLRHALELALENDLTESALRAYFNLAYLNAGRDRLDEAIELDEKGLELARRRGKRHWEQGFLGHLRADRLILGEWDGLESPLADPSEPWENLPWQARLDFSHVVISVALARGRIDEAQQMYSLFPDQPSAEVQERASHALGRALIARAQGRYAEALAAAEETLITDVPMGPEHPFFKHGFAEALEAALALGNLERAETLLGVVRGLAPVERVPLLEAQATRFAARLATIRGESSSVDNDFKRSAALLREIGARFWLAVVLLEHGEWLAEARRGEEAEPLLDEAGEIFERLEAAPWVERLHGARAGGAPSTAAVLGSG
jgi:tetratricopeptide (TPR) repeat protein